MTKRMMLKATVGMFCLALVMGCATSSEKTTKTTKAGGMDPKMEVSKFVGEWGSALVSKDVDKVMGYYSDTFKDGEGRDKAALKDFIKGAIDAGYLDGAKVDVAAATITVNGDQATVNPVNLTGNGGGVTVSLTLKKEAAGWRIVSSSAA